MHKWLSKMGLLWLAIPALAQTDAKDRMDLAPFAGKSLAAVTHAPPKPRLVTPGSMGGTVPVSGLVGVLTLGVINGIVKSHASNMLDKLNSHLEGGLEDPAIGIAKALLEALRTSQNAPVLPDIGIAADKTIESAITAAQTAQWLIEVSTVSWGVVHFPTDWSHYRVPYVATLRVVDVAGKRVIAESMCVSTQGETRRPSIQQLATRNASLLRFYFQQAQFECADQFAAKVFGVSALPRPADALTDYRDNLSADDETAMPDLPKAGQDDYKDWLTKRAPKAFAVGDTVKWGWAVGMKPADPSAPVDVAMRALHNCKRSYKQNCKLYAVNGKVVEGSDYAERMVALFERGSSLATAPTQDSAGTPDPQAQAINVTPTGFAKISEPDLVPYLSDKGRAAYKAWLGKPSPKAFSISASGNYAESVGTKPADTAMPTDPVERSLAYCNKSSPLPCKPYAVNGDVVFALEW